MQIISIDAEDYKLIANHVGYRTGFRSGVVELTSIKDNILEKLKKYLSKAEGAVVKFSVHPE